MSLHNCVQWSWSNSLFLTNLKGNFSSYLNFSRESLLLWKEIKRKNCHTANLCARPFLSPNTRVGKRIGGLSERKLRFHARTPEKSSGMWGARVGRERVRRTRGEEKRKGNNDVLLQWIYDHHTVLRQWSPCVSHALHAVGTTQNKLWFCRRLCEFYFWTPMNAG